LGSGGGTASDILKGGNQLIIPDAIAYLRSKGLSVPSTGNQGGTLLASFSGLRFLGDAGVTVRTATVVPKGRAGLPYSGIPDSGQLNETAYLCGLRQNEKDRSNVAL
jgi:hypothetical protein